MSYSGAHNLDELRKRVVFTRISQSAIIESNVHGI